MPDFFCEICDYKFNFKCRLKTHFASVHEKKKPFKCFNCDKIFSSKSIMKNHFETIHERKTPPKCSICKHSFSTENSLKRHIESVHEGKRPHKCCFCDKSFPQASALKKHVESVHEGKTPKQVKCSLCEYSCRPGHLKLHITQGKKPHECSTCGKRFPRKGILTSHIEKVHEKKKSQLCIRVANVVADHNDL